MTPEPDAERQAAVHALESSFSELMTVFRRFVSEAAERVSPGMLPATFKTLSVVSRFGPLTLSALAERLSADKGFLSRAISDLEGMGLVGRDRLSEARAPHESRLHEALADWSVDEIEHLSTMLHALAVGEVPGRR